MKRPVSAQTQLARFIARYTPAVAAVARAALGTMRTLHHIDVARHSSSSRTPMDQFNKMMDESQRSVERQLGQE